MDWSNFDLIFPIVMVLFIFGFVLEIINYRYKSKILNNSINILIAMSIIILMIFIIGLWISLDRPPLRTLGETRLWYSLLIPIIGLAMKIKWKIKWLNLYCIILSSVFLIITMLNPESYDKTLMPALQSIWFVPHVIVYMVGYALLGASCATGFHGIYLIIKNRNTDSVYKISKMLTVFGFVFITLGLVFGAFWAKTAWGHYWTWDPKETWAFLSWIAYLLYIHLVIGNKYSRKFLFLYLFSAFILLLLCWFGINYISFAAESIHTY